MCISYCAVNVPVAVCNDNMKNPKKSKNLKIQANNHDQNREDRRKNPE